MKRIFDTFILRAYAAVIICGCVCVGGFLFYSAEQRQSFLAVHYFDVGQGDSALVSIAGEPSVLIDGGPDNTVLAELGQVMPWWRYDIDYLVISHPDLDHFAGLLGVVEKYDIGEVLYNGDQGDQEFQLLLSMVQERHIPIKKVTSGDRIILSHDVTMEFVWPPDGYDKDSKNARSLVALLTKGSRSFLFTGDLPSEEEKLLLERYPSLITDVLKVGHHGSKHSSSLAFLKRIHPSYCIISVGADNSYGHPAQRVLDALRELSCYILTTMEKGSITLVTNGTDIQLGR